MPTAIIIFDSSKPENIDGLRRLAALKKMWSVVNAEQDAADADRLIITFGETAPATPAVAARLATVPQTKPVKPAKSKPAKKKV